MMPSQLVDSGRATGDPGRGGRSEKGSGSSILASTLPSKISICISYCDNLYYNPFVWRRCNECKIICLVIEKF